MEWINKLVYFFLGLFAIGLIWLVYHVARIVLAHWLQKFRRYLGLRHALKEMAAIRAGKIVAAGETEYDAQENGGMIIRTYKHGKLMSEEQFSAWEWKEQQKMSAEFARQNTPVEK